MDVKEAVDDIKQKAGSLLGQLSELETSESLPKNITASMQEGVQHILRLLNYLPVDAGPRAIGLLSSLSRNL